MQDVLAISSQGFFLVFQKKNLIKYQFNYFPLVWMFCSRQSNNLINEIQERSLRINYKDQKTSYQNLLETDNELMIHQGNLQVLMTEIYKIVNSVALTNYEVSIMNNKLWNRNNYIQNAIPSGKTTI